MYATSQRGFTLIELMIVVAVIGALVSVAIPAYQDYMVRMRIVEGLSLATDAKVRVVESASTVLDLQAGANAFNLQAGGAGAKSKFVTRIQIDNATGVITITYDPATVGGEVKAAANTLLFSPYVSSGAAPAKTLAAALAGKISGALEWVCTSAATTVAVAKGFAGAAAGTLIAKYAPSDCR
ncbi:MAG: pilin [Methylococcaceae bacterium]|nr:pilin [Methylococcaceae bacterium]